MLLLYTHTITPRLRYIVDFVSEELLHESIVITDDPEAFIYTEGPRICYHHEKLSSDAFHIIPQGLLFEETIQQQKIQCFDYQNQTAFFATTGDYPFDIFSAIFYLISRYEEYLPHQKDKFGLFDHRESLAYKASFLQKPLVNIWLDQLKSNLQQNFPEIIFKRKAFNCQITYDIDMAYSYHHKGWMRNTGAALRNIWKRNWKELVLQVNVLRGKIKDPFDCFEALDALHLYCRIKPVYFFLVAKNRSVYDKNINPASRDFQHLIEYYAGKYDIGLHPSWKSFEDAALLKEEAEWLEVIAEKTIRKSRQHYLRFSLPDTFRQLIQIGIEKEYSMGYGDTNGFRASVASPFQWFDLQKNESTSLKIFPFCFMEATNFFETKTTPENAYRELLEYYNIVKKYHGTFITVWHNHLLGFHPETEGWRKMFELFMRHTIYWDAYSDKT